MLFPDDVIQAAAAVVSAATRRDLMVVTAESCTGGLVAGALTAVAGSSSAVSAGFVTYSNAAKTRLIGVPAALIDTHGAVSEPVARAMAEGAVVHGLEADGVSVAVTGIAGPGGGSLEKPVGLVHFASQGPRGPQHVERRFGDLGRDAVRMAAVRQALAMLAEQLADD